jgi:hypothetical protein
MTTTTPTITLRQVLDLAHQLPRPLRAELIAQLARELVTEEPTPKPQTNDAWERLNAFRAELATRYPNARIGDQLDADRRGRQASIEGRGYETSDDVHV